MNKHTYCPNTKIVCADLMDTDRCQICGAPVEDNANLCISCAIEKYISESSSQIEM